jgi:hypothetical protein
MASIGTIGGNSGSIHMHNYTLQQIRPPVGNIAIPIKTHFHLLLAWCLFCVSGTHVRDMEAPRVGGRVGCGYHKHVVRDANEIHDVAKGRYSCRVGRFALSLTAFGFGKRQHHEREKQPRRARPDEGMTPAPFRGDDSANDRAQCRADWNGDVENGQGVVPFRRGIAVGNQARTDRRIARFTKADEHAKRKHHSKRRREPRQDGAHAPYKNAGGDEPFARATVAEPAEDRRCDEVADHERRHEPPGLTVIDAEIFLQRRQNGRENIAVEVIEQIEAGKNEENPRG